MQDPVAAIMNVRDGLAELMSSPDACEEYLQAMGHMDGAVRVLGQREARLQEEQERARIEQEAQASGVYDTFEDDPRSEPVPAPAHPPMDPGDVERAEREWLEANPVNQGPDVFPRDQDS